MKIIRKAKMLKKELSHLRNNGFFVKTKYLSRKECNFIKNKIIKIAKDRSKKGEILTYGNGQYKICNYFLEDPYLTKYVTSNYLDNLMSKLLGKSYVLRVGDALNNQIDKKYFSSKKKVGWHTDWLYNYDDIKFGYGGSFHTIIALDDFTEDNGPTELIPKSHKINKKPKRYGNYKSKKLIMKSGSLAIIDSSLWHKPGEPTLNSRWAIWNVYTQWWVKPYFRFNKMFKKSVHRKFDERLKRLFHFKSEPPLNSKIRRNTVI